MDEVQQGYEKALERIRKTKASGSQKLDLGGLGLTGIDLENLMPEIKELNHLKTLLLNDNKLFILPKQLGELTQLENLELSNNQIYEQSLGPLAHLSSLKCLDLGNNVLRNFPEVLLNLKNLEQLSLARNQLTEIFVDFKDLPALKILNVAHNNFRSFPPEILEIAALEELNMAHCNLEALPIGLTKLQQLKGIDLRGNWLSGLPEDFGNLVQLELLNVKDNLFQEVPNSIWDLKGLARLDLSNNKLSELSGDVGKLTKLQQLSLFGNEIRRLPPEMAKLSLLKRLQLGCNKLIFFPKVLLQLKSLEQLGLEGNNLGKLPAEFENLTALRALNLEYTNCRVFPDAILKLEALEQLNMASNRLSKLPDGLTGLQQLESLDLQNNRINALPEKFGNLVNLGRLNLERNWLQELPDSFGGLAGLEVLDLSDNSLCRLSDTLANLIPELGLTLDLNPLEASAIELLSNNFNHFSHPERDHGQKAVNRFNQVLAQLYPNTSEVIHDQIEKIALGDLEVTEELSRSAVAVLKEFLSKIPVEHAHAKEVYLPAVQFLMDKVLDTTLTEEERQLTLQKMLTALGDCGTPVHHFLTQTFVFECMDKEQGIPDQVQDILIAMAVEKAIRTKLKEQLKGPEAIEQVAALLHCLFLKNAAAMKCNEVKIQGTSVSLPPFSRHVKFGFTQIPKELANAFLKLCCQEKDGQLLQQQGKYLADDKKMAIMMVDPFMADLDPTLASPRELLVRDYEEKINTLLQAHDLTSWIDKEDVKKLLQTNQHQEELRKLLLYVPDDKIQDTYHKFLRKKEFEAFSLDLKYNKVSKAKALSALTTASTQRTSSLEDTPLPPSTKVKLHRKHSM